MLDVGSLDWNYLEDMVNRHGRTAVQEALSQIVDGTPAEPAAESPSEEEEKPYSTWVRWGQGERTDPMEYRFHTEQELDAFLLGVEEGVGWLDYETFESQADALRSACRECTRELGTPHDPACGKRVLGHPTVVADDCCDVDDDDEDMDVDLDVE